MLIVYILKLILIIFGYLKKKAILFLIAAIISSLSVVCSLIFQIYQGIIFDLALTLFLWLAYLNNLGNNVEKKKITDEKNDVEF